MTLVPPAIGPKRGLMLKILEPVLIREVVEERARTRCPDIVKLVADDREAIVAWAIGEGGKVHGMVW